MAVAMSYCTHSWPNQGMASATPHHTESSAPVSAIGFVKLNLVTRAVNSVAHESDEFDISTGV